VSDLDPPAFPLPREREPPSPYREKILPAADAAPPPPKPRLVVTRPDPPGAPRPLELPDDPRPARPFAGWLRVLRAPLVFLGNHPHLCVLLLAAALGLAFFSSWMAELPGGFAG
jgi:hypothetical protein